MWSSGLAERLLIAGSRIGIAGDIVWGFVLGFSHLALEHIVSCPQYELLGVTDLLIDSILTPIDIASI